MKTMIALCGFFCFAIVSCKDKKLELTSAPLSDYAPLQVGKYITYRLDSTIPNNFGAALIVRSYRVRNLVDAQITDNLGRKAYRILRTITDTNGLAPYRNNATFSTVPVGTDWVEHIDNNLRYMVLRWPIREGMEWKGHSFIDVTSINSPVRYLADWNYAYKNIGQPATIKGKVFENTVSILQRDETIPEGPFSPTAYKQKNYGFEQYAKGVGLVYKEFLHYIYQPPTSTRGGYYEDESYGVKLQILDFN